MVPNRVAYLTRVTLVRCFEHTPLIHYIELFNLISWSALLARKANLAEHFGEFFFQPKCNMKSEPKTVVTLSSAKSNSQSHSLHLGE